MRYSSCMQSTDHSRGILRIQALPEYVETLSVELEALFNLSAVETQRPHTTEVQLDVYFDTEIEAQLALKALPASLPLLSAEATGIRGEDWTQFWQHHFSVEEIGKRLRIVPYWEEAPQDERVNLLINPGLSFGTGGHFTTHFCLQQLEIAIQEIAPTSLIDAGSGSGILSIAAAKLGISSITAFDMDPIAVEQAKANATLNKVEFDVSRADLLDPAYELPKADLVCANILSQVLIEAAPKLLAATQQRLILSGIRVVEADQVASAYSRAGAKECKRIDEGTWCGLVMER
jgi:ribosomal protein L11 methyltransferase